MFRFLEETRDKSGETHFWRNVTTAVCLSSVSRDMSVVCHNRNSVRLSITWAAGRREKIVFNKEHVCEFSLIIITHPQREIIESMMVTSLMVSRKRNNLSCWCLNHSAFESIACDIQSGLILKVFCGQHITTLISPETHFFNYIN